MEFVCPDPKATVRAANVRATLAAFRLFPEVGQRIIQRNHLDIADLREDNFILVQNWLDALKEIQETVGEPKVREVGTYIVETADFPPHFADARAILLALDDIYHMNHRGDVGRYVTKELENGALEVRCETPYPRMFERGLVEGICKNPRAGGRYLVDYRPLPTTSNLTCVLTVRPR